MKHARKILTTLEETFTIRPTAIDYKFYFKLDTWRPKFTQTSTVNRRKRRDEGNTYHFQRDALILMTKTYLKV